MLSKMCGYMKTNIFTNKINNKKHDDSGTGSIEMLVIISTFMMLILLIMKPLINIMGNKELLASIKTIILNVVVIGSSFSFIIVSIYIVINRRKLNKERILDEYEEAMTIINTPMKKLMNDSRKENFKETFSKYEDVDFFELKEKYV